MNLLARRPVASAVIAWLLLASVTRGVLTAASDVEQRDWPVWVLTGLVVYGAFAIWMTTTEKFTASQAAVAERTIGVRFAMAATPVILSSGLAFQGLPSWAIVTALALSGLMLAAVAGLARREQAGASTDHG